MGEIRDFKKTELPYYPLYALLFEDWLYSSMRLESLVLYSMLLPKVGLSEKSNWRDDKQCIFVYCTLDEAGNFLRCRRDKAMKTLRELERHSLIIRQK